MRSKGKMAANSDKKMTAKSDKKNKWLPKQIKRIAAKLYKNGRQTEKQKQNGCQISKWPPNQI